MMMIWSSSSPTPSLFALLVVKMSLPELVCTSSTKLVPHSMGGAPHCCGNGRRSQWKSDDVASIRNRSILTKFNEGFFLKKIHLVLFLLSSHLPNFSVQINPSWLFNPSGEWGAFPRLISCCLEPLQQPPLSPFTPPPSSQQHKGWPGCFFASTFLFTPNTCCEVYILLGKLSRLAY